MARPSQYSRGRRVVMQVTLLAVLLGTASLAALLAQSRARAMSVELTDKPIPLGRLALRPPKGWQVMPSSDDASVTIAEPKRPGVRGQRAVVVQQVSGPSLESEVLLQRHVGEEDELRQVGEIDLLGRRGLMARFDRYEMRSPQEVEVVPTWTAVTVVPGAGDDGQDLGVVIDVRGMGVHGPAGSRLLRQVLDGLSLRETRPTTSKVDADSPGK